MSTRRAFITLLGGAAAAWPLAVHAQQPGRMRRVGVLMGGAQDEEMGWRLVAFQRALKQLGWVEGRNVQFDIRWGANDAERVGAHAKDLAQLAPDVILVGRTNALRPLLALTRSIPIVFVQVSDPLGQGIVESVARPTGNVTGFSNLEFSLLGKWLQILKEIAPSLTRVAVMIHTSNAVSARWFSALETLRPSLAVEPIAAPVSTVPDIENALEALARKPNGGLIVPGDTFVERPPMRQLIVERTASLHLPALYTHPAFVREGGLMSYGIDQTDPYRRAASYVDRILKGEKPADLPVQQPTKFELVINLKTAKALGLTVSLTLQASADEVLE